MTIHLVAASFFAGGVSCHQPHAAGCPSGAGGESQGLTFSFLQLLASSSLLGYRHPAGSPSAVPEQLVRASCSQSWGEGPASALISSFLAKSPAVSRWELNDCVGCLVVKEQRRNHSSHCWAPWLWFGEVPSCARRGLLPCPVVAVVEVGSSLPFAGPTCAGKGSGRREGVSTLCRCAGAVAPLKLIGWLIWVK